jgi:hypothetical protein
LFFHPSTDEDELCEVQVVGDFDRIVNVPVQNQVGGVVSPTVPSQEAILGVERELLEVHPAVECRGHPVRIHHVPGRTDRDEDVLAVDPHHLGVPLVPDGDVGHPDFVPEELLPQQIASTFQNVVVLETHVFVHVLDQDVRFEL